MMIPRSMREGNLMPIPHDGSNREPKRQGEMIPMQLLSTKVMIEYVLASKHLAFLPFQIIEDAPRKDALHNIRLLDGHKAKSKASIKHRNELGHTQEHPNQLNTNLHKA